MRNNPFNIKTLDQFTISDCEAYLKSRPGGDHASEVRKRMAELKRAEAGRIVAAIALAADANLRENKSPKRFTESTINQTYSKVEKKRKRSVDKNSHDKGKNNKDNLSNESPLRENASEEKNVSETLQAWILLIVAVIICGTMIIFLLEHILSEGALEFVKNHKIIIYLIVLSIGKCFDKN